MASEQQRQSAPAQQTPNIYKILSRRAFVTRSISIALVIILIIAATFISNMLVSWKDNQSSWVSQIYEAYNNPKGLRPGDLVLFRIKDNERKVGVFLGNDLGTGKEIVQQPNASVEIPPKAKILFNQNLLYLISMILFLENLALSPKKLNQKKLQTL